MRSVLDPFELPRTFASQHAFRLYRGSHCRIHYDSAESDRQPKRLE